MKLKKYEVTPCLSEAVWENNPDVEEICQVTANQLRDLSLQKLREAFKITGIGKKKWHRLSLNNRQLVIEIDDKYRYTFPDFWIGRTLTKKDMVKEKII